MAKSFLKLDKRRPLRDGTYPIVFVVGYGRNMQLATNVSCSVEQWDDAAQMCLSKPKNQVLKTIHANYVARILDLREQGIFDRIDNKQLKRLLADPDASPVKEQPSLAGLFASVMEAKGGRTAKIYDSTLLRLRRYCNPEKVRIDDVNKVWLDGFVRSMADLKDNTKSIHLRNLRAVNNYAIDCELTSNYPFRRYRLPKAQTRKRAMDAQTLRAIAEMELEPWLAFHRDAFMLSFYLIGINVVDLCNLKAITNGRIEYVRAKTHKPYSVKVEPEALAIINRLRGEKHLLCILERYSNYRTYYMQQCRALAVIRDRLGLTELTSYWARHSWATIAAELDIPKETIARGLGHGGNSVTDIYIDFDLRKVDEANRRVIDYVLNSKAALASRQLP